MASLQDDIESFALEQTLFHEENVWFYRIPATQISTLSPRADQWDHENPFLTGSLKILQRGDECFIQLFEPLPQKQSATETDGKKPILFAQSPVRITKDLNLEVYVQDCADSSRYFMITVEDEASKRRAYVGIGFPQRPSAFNFKASLQDYVKYRHRQMETENLAASGPCTATSSTEEKNTQSTSPTTSQYSLPQGATIRINLKTNSSGVEKSPTERPKSCNAGGTVPLIPPPPGSNGTASPLIARPVALGTNVSGPSSTNSVVNEDDWGDFTSA
jgi:hypothetical protein